MKGSQNQTHMCRQSDVAQYLSNKAHTNCRTTVRTIFFKSLYQFWLKFRAMFRDAIV